MEGGARGILKILLDFLQFKSVGTRELPPHISVKLTMDSLTSIETSFAGLGWAWWGFIRNGLGRACPSSKGFTIFKGEGAVRDLS